MPSVPHHSWERERSVWECIVWVCVYECMYDCVNVCEREWMFVSECVCCFIFVITIKYSDPINFKVCVCGGGVLHMAYSFRGDTVQYGEKCTAGGVCGQAITLHQQWGKAESEQEGWSGQTIPKPTPSNTLPPARLYIIGTPQGSQAVSQAGDQVSNDISQWGHVSHSNHTHKYIIIYISHMSKAT